MACLVMVNKLFGRGQIPRSFQGAFVSLASRLDPTGQPSVLTRTSLVIFLREGGAQPDGSIFGHLSPCYENPEGTDIESAARRNHRFFFMYEFASPPIALWGSFRVLPSSDSATAPRYAHTHINSSRNEATH